MKGFTVSASIVVQDQEDKVLRLLWNISTLEIYEPKVSKIIPGSEINGEGTYIATGHFGISKWKGQFSYRKTSTGFISATVKPIHGNSISGGFVVQAIQQGILIHHWEHYELAKPFRLLTPFVKVFLRLSIRCELKNIERILDTTSPN